MLNSIKSNQRILVVDDEPSLCQTLRLILTCAGYKVETAWSGKEALTILREERYDLVVTDFSMSGMKGDELAKTIRERWPNISVIMLTGSAEEIRASGIPLLGVDVLISKPFAMEEFRKTVSMVLGGGELCESAELTADQ